MKRPPKRIAPADAIAQLRTRPLGWLRVGGLIDMVDGGTIAPAVLLAALAAEVKAGRWRHRQSKSTTSGRPVGEFRPVPPTRS